MCWPWFPRLFILYPEPSFWALSQYLLLNSFHFSISLTLEAQRARLVSGQGFRFSKLLKWTFLFGWVDFWPPIFAIILLFYSQFLKLFRKIVDLWRPWSTLKSVQDPSSPDEGRPWTPPFGSVHPKTSCISSCKSWEYPPLLLWCGSRATLSDVSMPLLSQT